MNADQTPEARVRMHWKRVTYSESGLTPDGPCYVVISLDDHPTAGTTLFMKHGVSKEAVFDAALAFTLAHKQKIADATADVEWLKNVAVTTAAFIASIYVQKSIKHDAEMEMPKIKRILERETSLLTELRRGWRDVPGTEAV